MSRRVRMRRGPLMSVFGPAITTALSALRLYSRRVDRFAGQIASVGLTDLPTDAGDSAGRPGLSASCGPAVDLTDAMTNMLIAQRAFSANSGC